MNWEIAGAIGEIVGGVAVIVSLIYLSLQIRSTNRQVRTESIYNMQVEQNSISRSLSSDPEMLALLVKSRDSELSEFEEIRLGFFIATFVGIFVAIDNAMLNDSLDEAFYMDTKAQFENMVVSFKLKNRITSFLQRNHPNVKSNGLFESVLAEEAT